jgi:hypothetical protein
MPWRESWVRRILSRITWYKSRYKLRFADRNFLHGRIVHHDVHKFIMNALVPFYSVFTTALAHFMIDGPRHRVFVMPSIGSDPPFVGVADTSQLHGIFVQPHSSCATSLTANNHLSSATGIPL